MNNSKAVWSPGQNSELGDQSGRYSASPVELYWQTHSSKASSGQKTQVQVQLRCLWAVSPQFNLAFQISTNCFQWLWALTTDRQSQPLGFHHIGWAHMDSWRNSFHMFTECLLCTGPHTGDTAGSRLKAGGQQTVAQGTWPKNGAYIFKWLGKKTKQTTTKKQRESIICCHTWKLYEIWICVHK